VKWLNGCRHLRDVTLKFHCAFSHSHLSAAQVRAQKTGDGTERERESIGETINAAYRELGLDLTSCFGNRPEPLSNSSMYKTAVLVIHAQPINQYRRDITRLDIAVAFAGARGLPGLFLLPLSLPPSSGYRRIALRTHSSRG
jgi:hypothetical protein